MSEGFNTMPKSVHYKVITEGDLVVRTTTVNLAKLDDVSNYINFVEQTLKKRFNKNKYDELDFKFNHLKRYVAIGSRIKKRTFIINGKPIELYVGDSE